METTDIELQNWPTAAADFRTAAKVLRFIHHINEEALDEMPFWKRWWCRMSYDYGDLPRRSAILEKAADRLESLINLNP